MKKTFIIITALLAFIIGLYATGMIRIDGNGMISLPGAALPIVVEEAVYFEGVSGYFVRPANEKQYPGIVLIHENRGLRPEIKQAAEDLAKEGYMVLAVDLLGKVVETQVEARELTSRFNQEIGMHNMRAAAMYLRLKGAPRIASLGWCFGGGQSLRLALSGEQLSATVIYYGQLATSTLALAPLNSPVLGIFGSIDQVIATSTVRQFEKILNQKGVVNEIYIYDGVGHAFANPSNPNFAPGPTADAWKKTLIFLKKYLHN